MAPMPSFMPSSWRIGPLISEMVENEVVLDERNCSGKLKL